MDDLDLIQHQERVALSRHEERARQFKMRAGVGEVVSRVTASPDWKLYVDHLQTIQKRLEAEIESTRNRLCDATYRPQKETQKLRFDLAVKSAHLKGLTQAVATAYSIIEEGKRSKEQLDNMNN